MNEKENKFWTAILGLFLFGAIVGFMAGLSIAAFM